MHADRLRLPQSAATIRLPSGNPDLMTLTFDDFQPGRFGTFGPRHVTREEMLAFAAEFDPQPMHLDEEAASRSMLKGLSGSGWHLCSIMMRMMFDGFIGRTASLGSPGVNEVRWLAPLRPGDDLMLDVDVVEARDFEEPTRDRHRDLQMHGAQRQRPGAVRDGLADHGAAARPRAGGGLMRFFEDIAVGQRRELGSFTFTADGDQALRRAIRSAALPSRRGGGPQIAVRRARRIGLACRLGLHEATGRRQPAPEQPRRWRGARRSRSGDPRRVSASCAGSSRCWPAIPSALPARSCRSGYPRSRPEWGILQGAQQRNQSARRTGVLDPRDRVRAAAELRPDRR